MLYVTTLDRSVTFTAQVTLEKAVGPDGGLFSPFSLPRYAGKSLRTLLEQPFWDCVSAVLNQFFPLRLSGEALRGGGLGIPALVRIRHKIALAELWDHKTGSYRGLQALLLDRMGCRGRSQGMWPLVAMDVALLFALYGALCRGEWIALGEPVNLAVASAEFTAPMAAWYARRMGLPLGTVICVCNDNGAPWELLHRGELRAEESSVTTGLPLLDVGLPCNLERLIFETLGPQSVVAYCMAKRRKGMFSLNPEEQAVLREGFAVSVVGEARAKSLIPHLYHTADYMMSPYTALVYNGLMDFRSLEGEGTPALLLAEESPLIWGGDVLAALGIPVENVVAQIDALQEQAQARRKGQ